MPAVDLSQPVPDDNSLKLPFIPPIHETVDHPIATITSLDDARKRHEQQIKQKAHEMVEDLKFTGSYLELSLDREAYFARLDEIADAPDEEPTDTSKEGITTQEIDLLIAISVARMNQADASVESKNEQKAHLEDVYAKVTAAAKAEEHPVDLKRLQRSALLHDCGKFCPTMKKGDTGIEVVLSDDPAKKEKNIPKANPDLWGHNAHSALEALSILERLDPPIARAEALKIAKAILTHSDEEFPDEFALIKGVFVEKRNNYQAYNMFGTLFIRSRTDESKSKSREAQILHAADMIVGVGTGSYKKYLEQHVNNGQLVAEDTETMQDRGWTRLQSAVQTCFETSANNYFKAPHKITREMFGRESLANAQAYREWFRRFTLVDQQSDGSVQYSKDLLQLPDAQAIQEAITLVNTGDYTNPDTRKQIVASYTLLLAEAEQYAQSQKAKMDDEHKGSFTQQYYRQFLDEHSVVLEDEQQYWTQKFDTQKIDSERMVRTRKKEWKLNNTSRLQEAIAAT